MEIVAIKLKSCSVIIKVKVFQIIKVAVNTCTLHSLLYETRLHFISGFH